jgi:ribonuclease Z
MDKINLTLLGTSSAIPTATRNHSSIFIKYKDYNILIDCGEGTQRQLRKAKINPCKLTHILITHFHGDHIFGLPGLFHTLVKNNYSKTLHIYGPKRTKFFIKLFSHLSLDEGKIKIIPHEVTGKFLETKDFFLEALPLMHGSPCNGYAFIEKEKLRINKKKLAKLNIKNHKDRKKLSLLKQGKDITINNKKIKAKDFTFKEKPRKIAIVLDTKTCPNAVKLAKNADLAIIESTFLESEKDDKEDAKDYKHLTAKQAAQIAKKAKVKQLLLTHLSQRYEYKDKLVLNEAKKIFKNTKIAKDFMSVEL